MKTAHLLLLAFVVSLGMSGCAAQPDQHAGHRPAGANADMAMMDAQTNAMRQIHDKMMAAKTPEARNALMAEHMKTMHNGMTMMNGATPEGMNHMMGGMKGDMAMHHQMMEKRMDMMAASMQMMMDRLPAAPSK